MSFILYEPSFKGDEALLISCDDVALSWLLERLESKEEFLIGDDQPIKSMHNFTLVVRPSAENITTQLHRAPDNRFVWSVSDDSNIRFRKLIKSMLDSDYACHQYLNSEDKSSPVVVVSRNEY